MVRFRSDSKGIPQEQRKQTAINLHHPAKLRCQRYRILGAAQTAIVQHKFIARFIYDISHRGSRDQSQEFMECCGIDLPAASIFDWFRFDTKRCPTLAIPKRFIKEIRKKKSPKLLMNQGVPPRGNRNCLSSK
jgi:hypothetical protein